MPEINTTEPVSFRELQLAAPLLQALEEVGYETPSPIQAQAIPHLLKGLDLLGHAPTGTGKTAAFALPLLSRLDMNSGQVQIMTLTPTRELAIQVAEAFQRYAAHMQGFHVLPIYGGAEYGSQLRALERGVQVVVGTPGRVMDHMRKGKLKLDGLRALVLDEADEMLRMGFIDEVEWILEQMPAKRQMALFSATMPPQIERIARKHLNKPQEISIQARTATAETIRQRYWLVSGVHKLGALTRILEVEDFDAILMFVRTKIATTELAEKLEARGYAAAAMNGDMAQKDREKMVERLKRGSLDILVATDVAARGLDVERISLVINYDIPNDTEAYIHRIGRTGRAGRKGDAILFVAPRERRMLRAIETATRQKITELQMPTTETVNNKRIADFKQKISDTLAAGELAFMRGLVEQYQKDHDVPPVEIAAALAQLSIGDKPLLLEADKSGAEDRFRHTQDRPPRADRRPTRRERQSLKDRDAAYTDNRNDRAAQGSKNRQRLPVPPASDMERFRVEVGHDHGVKPGNIVGAIANEAGLDGEYIGQVEITATHSFVDLPKGMPKEVFKDLKKVWVCGQQLKISRVGGRSDDVQAHAKAPGQGNRKSASRGSSKRSSKRSSGGSSAGRSENKFGPRANPAAKRKPAPESGTQSAAGRAGTAKAGAGQAKQKSMQKLASQGKAGSAKRKLRHRDAASKGKPAARRKTGARNTSAN